MAGVDGFEAVKDGGLELLVGGVVAAVEAILFDELPQPLDQVEVGRVARQEQQVDAPCDGVDHHELAVLVARVVQHDGDGIVRVQGPQFVEQVADGLGGDVSLVDDVNQLTSDGIERSQHVEALTAGGGLDEGAAEAPDHGQERAIDKVRRVHEVDLALAGLGLIQHGIQAVFLKVAWTTGSALPGMGVRRRGAMPN